MAVDSRNKRASVLGFGLAALLVMPAPDGTIDQADRQHVAYSYPGITAGTPIAPDVIIIAIPAEAQTIAIDADAQTIQVSAEAQTILVPHK